MFPKFVRRLENPDGVYLKEAERRLSFYHIQKTAGSTFRYLLEEYFRDCDICRSEIFWEVERAPVDAFSKYSFFGGHFRMETFDKHLAQTVKVTFLRNPIDRFLSEFSMDSNQDRRTAKWSGRAQELAKTDPSILDYLDNVVGMPLEEYLQWDNKRAQNKYRNHQTRRLAKVTPRTREMPDWDEDILAEAKHNLRHTFDFCGLVEEFDLSIKLFCLTFGVLPYASTKSYTQNIDPLKKTSRRAGIPNDLIQQLEDYNRMDMELWKYGKELLYERLVSFQRAALAGSRPQGLQMEKTEIPAGRQDYSVESFPPSRGLHLPEKDGIGRSFRWTGREPLIVFEIVLPDNASGVRVGLEALNAINEDCVDSLSFTVNGIQPDKIKRKCKLLSSGVQWEGDVHFSPENAGKSVHLLKIDVPQVAIEGDGRKLGIALSKLKVTPL